MNQTSINFIRSTATTGSAWFVSIAYRSAHAVFRLESEQVVSQILSLISPGADQSRPRELRIGTFGLFPATLYVTKREICFIVDGDPCGDGSNQSFGLHLPAELSPDLVESITAAYREMDA